MVELADFRSRRIPLNHGGGGMPALGFGTLIPDAATTLSATRYALEAGYRHFDCAERYRNEREVGEALREGLAAGGIALADEAALHIPLNHETQCRQFTNSLAKDSP